MTLTSPTQLAGIRKRVAETAKTCALTGGQPSQMAEDQEQLLADVDQLRAILERLIPSAHDTDSSACRERAARQERLSPCQQSEAEYDDECPACEALTVLDPRVRRG
ncbi:hypothetical protein [Streptosporangium sp. NPDC002524]|uniref:hypothetical protein n=1 Tax=Streptosporangium sp. NPDC002524 TaxID=3154537 RepID=UPI0033301690